LFKPHRLSASNIVELNELFLAVLDNVCKSPESRTAILTV
jgi:hypothetical protein